MALFAFFGWVSGVGRVATLALLLSAAAPCTGWAQLHRVTDPVALPASAYINHDDALGSEVNPALLGLLPAFGAAYVHAELDSGEALLGRGDALYLASPLPLGLAAALSLHSLRPGERSREQLALQDHGLVVLSAAFAPSPVAAFGLATRATTSTRAQTDGVASVDVGVVVRPSPILELSVSGRDLFLSREGLGLAGLGARTTVLGGVQVRPLGTSDLVLDATLGIDTAAEIGGRGALGLGVPYVGLLSAVAEVRFPEVGPERWHVLAELSASFGQGSAALGAGFGDGFGSDVNGYAMLRFDGRPRPGVPAPRRVVLDLTVKDLSPRSFLALSRRLDEALHDERLAGVLLRPRGSKLGSALAQELRLQIGQLRKAGKYVACHLENAAGAEFYACAAADEVFIDPAGSVRLMGRETTVLLFGEMLRKIHVRADFLRIGDHKSAPEQFAHGRLSEPARRQLNGLLDDVQQRTIMDLARDLACTPEEVAVHIDEGPQLADQAIAAAMVDGAVDGTELSGVGPGGLSGKTLASDLARAHPRQFGVGARLGMVLIDGALVDGENVDIPVLGLHSTGGTTAVRAIEGLAADPTVRAIVVRIDSPGGSVLASDQIWRALYRARQRKPVVASMGAVAASGGYYVASAAQAIWADPSTVTGSIGVFYGKADVGGLAAKLGVGVEILRRGRHAGAASPFRAFTADERATLAERLRSYYRLFLARVAKGRAMAVEDIDAVGRGRVFSGDAAQRLGLVDRLGGLSSALAHARQLGHLGPTADVVVVPDAPGGVLGLLLRGGQSSSGLPAAVAGALPRPLRRAAAAVLSLGALDGAHPLALMPYDLTP